MTRLATVLCAAVAVCGAVRAEEAVRIFRPERFVRGDTNLRPLQALDEAAWIRLDAPVARFRCAFAVAEGAKPFEIDVTGDETFTLLLDGRVVCRGPHRGSVRNWPYQSYRLSPAAGEHLLEAVVTRFGSDAPRATLSGGGGFILKAGGEYDAKLTTGKGPWKAGAVAGVRSLGYNNDSFGGGAEFEISGDGVLRLMPSEWLVPEVAHGPMPDSQGGVSFDGWALYPSQLPDMVARRVSPGRIVAVRAGASDPNAPWRDSDAVSSAPSLSFAPGTRTEMLWDLGDYWCGYPELEIRGGKGAKIKWGWVESLRHPGRKGLVGDEKGNRGEFAGKYFALPFEDAFVCDGRDRAVFTTPWWRCGRWCRITVEAGAEPVELSAPAIVETRYPLEMESSFECEGGDFAGISALCLRGLQMCSHDISMDCPRYEQQMYPGDAMVNFRAMAGVTSDDRLMRRAVDVFDYSRRPDGSVPMNWPTKVTQNSTTWTLFWTLLVGDYVRFHANAEWLKARLAGFRHTMFGLEAYEAEDGLLANAPGWCFIDWVPEWRHGTVPDGGGAAGRGKSGILNLLYLMAMRNAEYVELAAGEPELAARWRRKGGRLAASIRAAFFDEARGLVADTVRKDSFSVHAQLFALLTDFFGDGERERAFEAVLSDKSLVQCQSYFWHFLFLAAFELGRPEVFFDKTSVWRDYLAQGLKAPLESPSFPRSDCHGFGSFPLFHLHTGLAGVTPSAPFFARVRVAPQPGPLTLIRARTPHPRGFVESDLAFAGGGVSGTVVLPDGISGEFAWRGRTSPLHSGSNSVYMVYYSDPKPISNNRKETR